MQIINQKVHINKDGVLKLNIPTDISDSDVELVVVINPLGQISDKLSDSEIQMIEESWEEYKRNPEKAKSWKDVKKTLIKKYGL